MADSLDPNQQRIAQAYQQGQIAFERGNYREAVENLAQASALVEKNTPWGGEIQIWLVTAYEAAGQRQDSLSLCRLLTQHADLETRKQSRRLLAILEAPQLKRPTEWLTQIPDLSNVNDIDGKARKGSSGVFIDRRPKPEDEPADLDPSQIETQDNQFIWVALLAILGIGGGLWWLGAII